MPHLNVSCQDCRMSRTYLTLQGVNAFYLEHEGHRVIEGTLFERRKLSEEPHEDEGGQPQLEAEAVVSDPSGPAVVQVPAIAEGRVDPPALPEPAEPAEVLAAPAAAMPALSEKDLQEPLLLARSSYIGDSVERRIDALKVSRALQEFRWNVEPPYVIGVMLENNLSVESNIGVVSSAMVEKVESLGYKFVAVNSPQGSPVAWFKKCSPQGGVAPDAERTLEITEAKRTYDQGKAVWEESFVSLLMTVKDMDAPKLRRVADTIKSAKPEPEIGS